jgi:hypothetical protein
VIDGGILLAVGLLVGSIVHALEERDKNVLRKSVVELEASHKQLEDKLRAAADREVRNRVERIRLVLQWARSRLETHLAKREVPVGVLQRVWGIGRSLSAIIAELPSDGTLDSRSAEFCNIIFKAQCGAELSEAEADTIDKYIAVKVPDFLREFYEDRLSAEFQFHSRKLEELEREHFASDKEYRLAELHERVEGGSLYSAAANQQHARHEHTTELIAKHELERQIIARSLVLVARLGRPELVKDDYDHLAMGILERIVRGDQLSGDDVAFLDAYRNIYFLDVRRVLKEARGIDIGGLQTP